MKRDDINAPDAPQPVGNYSQAVDLRSFERLLFISGQIPVASDGTVPDGFEAQARQAWANIDAQLRAAGMTKADLVKITIFLSDRAYAMPNRAPRKDYLGDLAPAMSVVIAGIFDESWLLEIEAIAAR